MHHPSLGGRIPILAAALAALLLPGAVRAQDEAIPLEGLVVTATPVPLALSALGTHVTVLDGDDLRARGLVRITDALRDVPGVTVVQNGSFGAVTSVFFRGGESDYVQVMVDGVQVNQPGGGFDFSGLTVEAVERIEVVRGPSSALHGSDAVAGVIHIITRDGARARPASLTVRGGNYGRWDGILSAAGGGDEASFGVTLSRYITDGVLPLNNAHDNTVLTGKASFRLDGDTRARFAGRIGERVYRFPTDFSGAIADENQQTFNDESSFSVELERGITERVQLRALATTYAVETGADDAPDGPADTLGFFGFQSLEAYRRNSLDLRANVALGLTLTGTVGAEYEEQTVRAFNESLSQFGVFTGRSDNSRENRAAYLHLAGGEGLVSANGGIRFEDNEFFGDFLTWQAGVSVRLAPASRIRAAAGRGIKEPTFFESFATGFVVGNPDLQPEVSDSWELGFEQEFLQGRVAVQATYFDQAFQDLIQYTGTPPAPGEPNYFNVARADASGVEASAQARLAAFRFGVDWTWLDTEVTDSGFDSGAGANFVEGEALLRRPEHTVGMTVDWTPYAASSLNLAVRRVGTRADRDFTAFPAAAVTLDAYTRVDLGGQFRVLEARGRRPSVDLLLAVENLLDEAYQEVFGFPAPGRAVALGGRIAVQ